MDASAVRVGATLIAKYSADLLRDATIAAERGEKSAYRDGALTMIGTLRRELTELELALKGEAVAPIGPSPGPVLRLVGSEPPEAA